MRHRSRTRRPGTWPHDTIRRALALEIRMRVDLTKPADDTTLRESRTHRAHGRIDVLSMRVRSTPSFRPSDFEMSTRGHVDTHPSTAEFDSVFCMHHRGLRLAAETDSRRGGSSINRGRWQHCDRHEIRRHAGATAAGKRPPLLGDESSQLARAKRPEFTTLPPTRSRLAMSHDFFFFFVLFFVGNRLQGLIAGEKHEN